MVYFAAVPAVIVSVTAAVSHQGYGTPHQYVISVNASAEEVMFSQRSVCLSVCKISIWSNGFTAYIYLYQLSLGHATCGRGFMPCCISKKF